MLSDVTASPAVEPMMIDRKLRMRALRGVFVLVLALVLSTKVLAADFQIGWEAYERGDYITAMKEWRPLAERGDDRAQYFLGSMYADGEGIPQDSVEAVKWYHLAAEQGDADAQFSLGGIYYYGAGIPQDSAEAVKWYHLAAEQGDAGAQIQLGNIYENGAGVPQDYVLAHMWFNLAAAHLPADLTQDLAALNRDFIEKRMTPGELVEAEGLARQRMPN